MDDTEIVQRISELAEEEHNLERSHAGEGLSEQEQAGCANGCRSCSTSAGTCCASAAHGDRAASTPTRRMRGRGDRRALRAVAARNADNTVPHLVAR